jgi:hypothetical protein
LFLNKPVQLWIGAYLMDQFFNALGTFGVTNQSCVFRVDDYHILDVDGRYQMA